MTRRKMLLGYNSLGRIGGVKNKHGELRVLLFYTASESLNKKCKETAQTCTALNFQLAKLLAYGEELLPGLPAFKRCTFRVSSPESIFNLKIPVPDL